MGRVQPSDPTFPKCPAYTGRSGFNGGAFPHRRRDRRCARPRHPPAPHLGAGPYTATGPPASPSRFLPASSETGGRLQRRLVYYDYSRETVRTPPTRVLGRVPGRLRPRPFPRKCKKAVFGPRSDLLELRFAQARFPANHVCRFTMHVEANQRLTVSFREPHKDLLDDSFAYVLHSTPAR